MSFLFGAELITYWRLACEQLYGGNNYRPTYKFWVENLF